MIRIVIGLLRPESDHNYKKYKAVKPCNAAPEDSGELVPPEAEISPRHAETLKHCLLVL